MDHLTYMELLDKFQELQQQMGKLEVRIDLARARVTYLLGQGDITPEVAQLLFDVLGKR